MSNKCTPHPCPTLTTDFDMTEYWFPYLTRFRCQYSFFTNTLTSLFDSSLRLPTTHTKTGTAPCLPQHREMQPVQTTDNLTKNERKALKSLQNDHSITARQADKGFCVVVMDTSQYIREGLTHLNDEIVYEILSQGQYTKALGIHLNIQYKKWLDEVVITCLSPQKKTQTEPRRP